MWRLQSRWLARLSNSFPPPDQLFILTTSNLRQTAGLHNCTSNTWKKGWNGNYPKWMLHQGSHSQGLISPSKMTSSFRGFDHSNRTPTDWPAFLFLRQQSHQIHSRILKCTLMFGISSILVVQVKRMALQQMLDSVSGLGGGSLPDFHTFFVLDKWKMQCEVKNPQPIIEAAASGRWDADWLWHFLLPALPIGPKANNGQQSSGVTRGQKKHEPRPANSTFGPFLFAYSLEMFTWLRARTHSCTAANCSSRKRGFASRWRDKRSWKSSNAAAEVYLCQCWLRVGSVCKCRCHPAGNPAALWLWSILLAGVTQYLSAKTLGSALLLHPFHFILFWKAPCSLSRRAEALLNPPRAVSPTQNILNTNRQPASDLLQTINPFATSCLTLFSLFILSGFLWASQRFYPLSWQWETSRQLSVELCSVPNS